MKNDSAVAEKNNGPNFRYILVNETLLYKKKIWVHYQSIKKILN